MVAPISAPWSPTKIRWIDRCHDTGSEVVELMTDAGPGYAKFLGGREGPHVLACEFIGTHLAALLGLPVFEHALLPYDGQPEIALHHGGGAKAGPAWITRKEEGFPWSGRAEDLTVIDNPDDLAVLVLLDLWTLNCDRYRPDPLRVNYGNVFLSRQHASPGKLRLVAMDHTHILTCGKPFTPAVAQIDRVQSRIRFGLFPGFAGHVTWARALAARRRLEAVAPEAIKAVVARVPREWQVDAPIRESLGRFLLQRKDWLIEAFPGLIFDQPELFA